MLKKWKEGALLAAATIMVAMFAACSSGDDGTEPAPEESKVTELTLYPETLTLALYPVGEGQLTATVSPKDAEVTVKWSSSNEEVATVDQTGKVTPVKTGTATITAEAGGKKATCAVTVKDEIIAVQSVSFFKPFFTLEIGKEGTNDVTIKPSDADDKTLTWKSSNEGIAQVDQTGKVTAVAVGNATITATSTNGISGKYTLTVNPHAHDFGDGDTCKTCGKKKLVMPGATINNQDILTSYTDRSESVKEVVIVDGVKGIAKSAFQGNYALESVTIPDSVTSIGESAFFQCKSLKNVNMGKGVTSIGKSAFSYTALESVTIGDSVEIIEDYAFYPCDNLKNITLPASVKKIGLAYSAFDLMKFPNVTYKGTLKQWCAVDSFDSFCVLSTSMVLEGENNFDLKNASELKIPDGVTKIGKSAFLGCQKLENVTIPASVTEIGQEAFGNCILLKDVTIPEGVTSIGVRAFAQCTRFGNVTIPDNVTSIGDGAFTTCTGLESVAIGKGVTTIGQGAFSKCNKLQSVTYNGTEKQWKTIKLGGDLFGDSSVKTITGKDGNAWTCK